MPTLDEKSSKDIGRALLRALREDNIEAAQYFLTAAEVDVRCFNEADMCTALNYATMKNNTAIAQNIIERGANVNSQNKEGYTPLHLAAKAGGVEVARLLLDKGAAPNIRTIKHFHTAQHFAALMGHSAVVQALIDKDADFNAQDKDGCTPLHYAAKSNCVDVVWVLLKKMEESGSAVNINARAKGDFTALHFAVIHGSKETVELLLAAGADLNAMDEKNYGVLHHAVKKGLPEVVRLLLMREVEVNSVARDGKRPQDLTKNPEILADLQSCGAIIEGFTPPPGYKPVQSALSERQAKIKQFAAFEKYFSA